jgi:hypothetical protein
MAPALMQTNGQFTGLSIMRAVNRKSAFVARHREETSAAIRMDLQILYHVLSYPGYMLRDTDESMESVAFIRNDAQYGTESFIAHLVYMLL